MAQRDIYDHFKTFQRRMLLWVLALSSMAAWAGYLMRPVFSGTLTHYIVLGMSTIPILTALLLYRRPRYFAVISYAFCTLVCTYLIYRNATSFHLAWQDLDVEGHTTTIAAWVPLVSTILFLMLPLKRAILFASSFYVGMAVPVALFYGVGPGHPTATALDTHLFLTYVLSHGLLIGVMAVFSKAKDTVFEANIRETMLQQLAHTDSLTALPNRRALEEKLDLLMEMAKTSAFTFSIGLLDIDHFKAINDTYGHDQGDRVLQKLANISRGHLRPTDAYGRWGGEEFLIILPACSITDAADIAERLRSTIEVGTQNATPSITVCIGVTEYQRGDTVQDLLRRADIGLYQAKQSGRNQVCIQLQPPPLHTLQSISVPDDSQ